MRTTTVSSFLTGLMSLSLAQAQTVVNITESNTADVDAGTGELGWGASGLSFGYSAGVGLNFSSGEYRVCVHKYYIASQMIFQNIPKEQY